MFAIGLWPFWPRLITRPTPKSNYCIIDRQLSCTHSSTTRPITTSTGRFLIIEQQLYHDGGKTNVDRFVTKITKLSIDQESLICSLRISFKGKNLIFLLLLFLWIGVKCRHHYVESVAVVAVQKRRMFDGRVK